MEVNQEGSKRHAGAKELKLTRPLVVLHVETTGVDFVDDHITDIACVKLLPPDGRRETRAYHVIPSISGGSYASQVSVTQESDGVHRTTFEEIAAELFDFLQGCDLSGFNIERFDLPFLARKFTDIGLRLETESVNIVDSLHIFHQKEPRDLRAACRFFCNSELADTATADAEASADAAADVLLAQIRRYDDLPVDVPSLHDYTHPLRPGWLDPDGRLVWRENQAVFNFGKYRNETLRDVVVNDPGYLSWMLSKNFSRAVVTIVQAALEGEFPVAPAAPAAAT